MADYIVKDTELTSVANAIRTAGGTNNSLTFPNGFVSAVENIGGGGGGGSSDFSTAEVTMTNPTMDELYFVGITVDDDGMYNDGGFVDEKPTNTIVLYKGTQTLYFEDTPSLTVTGSLEYDEIEGMLTVTGNGTITIS